MIMSYVRWGRSRGSSFKTWQGNLGFYGIAIPVFIVGYLLLKMASSWIGMILMFGGFIVGAIVGTILDSSYKQAGAGSVPAGYAVNTGYAGTGQASAGYGGSGHPGAGYPGYGGSQASQGNLYQNTPVSHGFGTHVQMRDDSAADGNSSSPGYGSGPGRASSSSDYSSSQPWRTSQSEQNAASTYTSGLAADTRYAASAAVSGAPEMENLPEDVCQNCRGLMTYEKHVNKWKCSRCGQWKR